MASKKNYTSLLPSKSEIARYWIYEGNLYRMQDKLSPDFRLNFCPDFGEPTCFACGESYNGKFDAHDYSTEEECEQAWNRSDLERCHIIPNSLGGTHTPDNLVLLCGTCHTESPDLLNPAIFWRWFQHREHFNIRKGRAVETLFASYGLDVDTFFSSVDDIQQFVNLCYESVSAEEVSTHGLSLPPSTILGYALSKWPSYRERLAV